MTFSFSLSFRLLGHIQPQNENDLSADSSTLEEEEEGGVLKGGGGGGASWFLVIFRD